MTKTHTQTITVKTTVNAQADKVWRYWTEPEHITRWNNASEDWHSPRAQNDLRAGGRFNVRMEARDGSQGFDFEGTYDKVDPPKEIAYTMDDGRKVRVTFKPEGKSTKIVETFEPETENPADMQRDGWQAILDSFKKYAESDEVKQEYGI